MSSTRALLARVQRLETQRMPRPSPLAVIYGTFAAFETECRTQMAAGHLAQDFPIDCLARWEEDGTWQMAR